MTLHEEEGAYLALCIGKELTCGDLWGGGVGMWHIFGEE